jgi:lipid A 3-O-deacylase
MRTSYRIWLIALFAATSAWTGLISPGSAHADDGFIDEIVAGALKHDVPIGGHHKEGGIDLNGEVLFHSPGILSWAYAPRPHVGLQINTSGKTDQIYAGLTWTLFEVPQVFTNDDKIFTNFAFGGAVHDGHLNSGGADDKLLGSRVLFRESLEIGYWFLPTNSVSLYADHESDAGLTRHNEGLTNLGIRFGFKL